MKYKLLKEFPGYPIGYIFESGTFPQFDVFNIKAYPDFFEEVKEPKTIYDLKEGRYFYLTEFGEIENRGVCSGIWSDNAQNRCFLTEREAKRNKLLRELATREKWLPEDGQKYIDFRGIEFPFHNAVDYILEYHNGLVFRNQEEYNKYMTEENKKLLFNI